MNRNFSFSDSNNRDASKGKSFRFSVWSQSVEFYNDDYIQDWVQYGGALYVCLNTNINEIPSNSSNWQLVVSGVTGPTGPQGEMGGYFTPYVDAAGNLSWTNNMDADNPDPVNIKGIKGNDGKDGATGPEGKEGKQGEQGPIGPQGVGLQFIWDGTKLGVKREDQLDYTFMNLVGGVGPVGPRGKTGNTGQQGPQGKQGEQGERGLSIQLQVQQDENGNQILVKRYEETEAWEKVLDLELLRGKPGKSIIVERNPVTSNIEYRYEDEDSTANRILIYKSEIIGPKGQSIARCYIADDGYLYIWLEGEDMPRRAGYVRGDKGFDGREIVLRVDNDKHLGPGEAGTGTHLQWKYAGDEYKLWTNLIQINELFNIALAGLKLEHEIVYQDNQEYDKLTLSSYETAYDEDGNLVLTTKIANLSEVLLPVSDSFKDIYIDPATNELVLIIHTSEGDVERRISLTTIFKAGNGIELSEVNTINVKLDTQSEVLADKTSILQVDQYGLKVKGLIDKLLNKVELVKTLNADQTESYYIVITADNGKEYQVELPTDIIFRDATYDPETKVLTFIYMNDPHSVEHTKQIDLSNLFNGALVNGGLGMTEDGLLYIEDGAITENMLSEEVKNLFVSHVEKVTYDEFVNLINDNSLRPGFFYVITDYQTIYNTSDGLMLGTDTSLYPSEHWNIQVEATSENTYDPNGLVVERPYLHIYYDHNHKIVNDKGQILAMHDHAHNVHANYDYVNTRFAITQEMFQAELTGLEFSRDVYYIPTITIFNGSDFENRYSPELLVDSELRKNNYIVLYLVQDSGVTDLQTLRNIHVDGNVLVRTPITTGLSNIELCGDVTFSGPINYSVLRGTFVGRGDIAYSKLTGKFTTNNFTVKFANCEGKLNLVNNLKDLTFSNTRFCLNNELDINETLANIVSAQELTDKEITDTTIRYIDEDVLTEQIIKF